MTAAHALRRLDRRTLNRTLLDRQLLAGPSALGLDAAVAHLVGLPGTACSPSSSAATGATARAGSS
ncbi:hypothetical protein [Trebonia kvetii]|uniref:hypothetical protein n=1 Tax=Trebonia kvetii TaxID=2480626 RepID=UPI0016522AC5|nr:hypothetical protein [Trebonia kvetii]